MDALMLDGNAVAGLLQEVFAVEMTTAVGTCNKSSKVGCEKLQKVTAAFQNASIPVTLCPIISVWISCVPS